MQKKIVLSENYRSPQMVLDAANTLVESIHYRIPKQLRGRANTTHDIVEKHEFMTWLDEADWVAEKIKTLHDEQGIRYNNMIILYRNRNPSLQAIDDALNARNIPFRYIGRSYYAQNYLLADQMINVFKLVAAPQNMVVLSDLFASLELRFGEENLFDKYLGLYRVNGKTVLEKLAALEPNDYLERFLKELAQFVLSYDTNQTYREMYNNVYDVLNIEGALNQLDDKRKDEEKKHLQMLYERVIRNSRMNFHQLLADLDLRNDDDQIDDTSDCVGISTLHTVKGLEYKVVFIIALEDFMIPGRNGGTHMEDEERRLLYVGMTRSESQLFLTYANRRIDGYQNQRIQQPSRFLKDIPVS